MKRVFLISIILILVVTLSVLLFPLVFRPATEIRSEVPYKIIEDDPKVDSKIISSYLLDGDLIIEYISDVKPRIEGFLSSDRYKIEEDRVTIFDYNDEYFKLIFGEASDIYDFGIPPETWENRSTKVVDYGNNTYTITAYMGPQVFWNGSDWEELYFEDCYSTDGYYLLRNAHVAIEVYDYYAKLFDPDYLSVSVYDERFEVQKYKPVGQGKWDDVGAQSGTPTFNIIQNETGVYITKTFESWAGTLEISYILKPSTFLKHRIVWTSSLTDITEFRVLMKLSGITSAKVRHKDGTDIITGQKSLVSPYLFFGENDQNLKLTEYFWSLGISENLFGEWIPTTLKEIVLDVHAQGSKTDIIIGNYTLSQNESLEIDPTTSTFYVSASTDDCSVGDSGAPPHGGNWDTIDLTTTYQTAGWSAGHSMYTGGGMRFQSVTVPQGATINSAYLKLICSVSQSGTIVNTNIDGEDVDDVATFGTLANYNGRVRTSALVTWDAIPGWTAGTEYTSTDIGSVVQEIVNIGTWVSGNAMVIFWEDDGSSTSAGAVRIGSSWNHATYTEPALEITYTAEQIENFYGGIGQQFTVNSQKTMSFNLYSSINQIISIGHVRQISFNRFLSINPTFTVSGWTDLVTNILNFFGSINQMVTVNGWSDLPVPAVEISTATTGFAIVALSIAFCALAFVIYRREEEKRL